MSDPRSASNDVSTALSEEYSVTLEPAGRSLHLTAAEVHLPPSSFQGLVEIDAIYADPVTREETTVRLCRLGWMAPGVPVMRVSLEGIQFAAGEMVSFRLNTTGVREDNPGRQARVRTYATLYGQIVPRD